MGKASQNRLLEEGRGREHVLPRQAQACMCGKLEGGVCVYTCAKVWVCLLTHTHETLVSVSLCISVL